MAHPKSKISKQRKAKRRTHYKATAPQISICKVTGEIRIDDEDIYDRRVDPVQLRAKVGMVFQKPNPLVIYWKLMILGNVFLERIKFRKWLLNIMKCQKI